MGLRLCAPRPHELMHVEAAPTPTRGQSPLNSNIHHILPDTKDPIFQALNLNKEDERSTRAHALNLTLHAGLFPIGSIEIDTGLKLRAICKVHDSLNDS